MAPHTAWDLQDSTNPSPHFPEALILTPNPPNNIYPMYLPLTLAPAPPSDPPPLTDTRMQDGRSNAHSQPHPPDPSLVIGRRAGTLLQEGRLERLKRRSNTTPPNPCGAPLSLSTTYALYFL